MTQNNPDSPTIIRVLLVDTQAVVRAGLRLFLEQSEEIRVIAEAADGESALALIQSTSPNLVILDLCLPKMGGLDILRQIRANNWPVNTLVFTLNEDDASISASLKSGANGYLLKFASPEEIRLAVKDITNGKTYLDKAVVQKVISQAASPLPALEPLTEREIEILSFVAKGLTNKVIAFKLHISDRTVQGHIARIFEKLHASSRTDAVMRAIASGIIQSPDNNREEFYTYEI